MHKAWLHGFVSSTINELQKGHIEDTSSDLFFLHSHALVVELASCTI